FDDVAHVHLRDVEFDGQGAGVFHGVVEDGGDLAAQADAAETLVGNEGDVFAGVPEHRVGGGLARGAGADHVADVGHQMAFFLQALDELDGADLAGLVGFDAFARVLEHGQRVQRDVGAAPGVGGGRQVVGVGFTGDLEDGQRHAGGDFGAAGEPFG